MFGTHWTAFICHLGSFSNTGPLIAHPPRDDNVDRGQEKVRASSHDIVFAGVQQLAALSVHEPFFIRDHVLLIAIRPEEYLGT